jgi:protein ImuB
LRLDQALGRLAEPVSSIEALPRFRVQSRLAEPIQDPTPYLASLCQELCVRLSEKGFGCRQLHLVVYRTDGEVSVVDVTTSAPSREADHLRRLFDDKLDRINPGFGFDLITLEAGAVEKLDVVQTRLDGDADDDLELSRLIDRLTARFGARSVARPVLRASHVPERAEGRGSAIADVQTERPEIAKERPIRLLDHPEEVRVLYAVPEGPPVQFIWRRQTHRITRYAGPERIAPEWWHDKPGTRLRDYFKVEDDRGRRFWLYREGLHDDGRGGDPRWFVHGMFA